METTAASSRTPSQYFLGVSYEKSPHIISALRSFFTIPLAISVQTHGGDREVCRCRGDSEANCIRDKQQRRKPSEKKEHLERLEMAQIKLEAALEVSDKWQISDADASLLRWRKKLKRAAQECDDTLRRCRQRVVVVADDDQEERRRASLPARLAHAIKSLVSSVLSGRARNDDDGGYGWSGSAVRRFEWFADGAAEFFVGFMVEV